MYIQLEEEIIVYFVSSLDQSFPKNIKNVCKNLTQGGGARYLYYMFENKVYQTKKHKYRWWCLNGENNMYLKIK